ncbi:WavE lipopolysaccharide synthesis family protein [Komagataeibacter saccharivorans]|uniref:WavE lipopolysaccharide synthesis family protein n=1 Tax=Komagataeibacter saccharivorans TaxID=265959 RepID=UPI0024A9E098|nr:WavE lipopolysaccharide synthesis family protein [Komagataeibacter saccharivorans]
MIDISKTGKNLSIVLQGGVFEKNSTEVTNIASEYRKLFPESEILLSISSSDFLNFPGSSENELIPYKQNLSNQKFINVCNILNSLVDKFIFCDNALPLPPVNVKHPNCNANYQIEAAKRGLAEATREFVLRVRNDFLFQDDSFINQYIEMSGNVRGRFSVFQERIMICSLFTINPYAVERLPFHYSDWFHFGKLADVRLLWDVPHISLNYMTYYMNNPYLPGSTELERHFLAKTGVEQYISFGFFSKHFPELKLACHNDVRSRRESIDILLDNFCILDHKKSPVYFPKYMNDFQYRPNQKICISHKSWDILSKNRNVDPEEILSYHKESIYKHDITKFPFVLNASDLKTKIGKKLGKDIVIPHTDTGGVAVFGPHFNIVGGSYRACIYISSLVCEGALMKVRATLDHGKEVLNEREFAFENYNNDFLETEKSLKIDFCFDCPHTLGQDFEIVIEVNRVEDMSISHIEIFDLKKNPDIKEMPLAFQYYMNISSKIMKKSLVEKRSRDPYAFFRDSKSILAKYPKKIFMEKYKEINTEE